jgi:hypothetical protein
LARDPPIDMQRMTARKKQGNARQPVMNDLKPKEKVLAITAPRPMQSPYAQEQATAAYHKPTPVYHHHLL